MGTAINRMQEPITFSFQIPKSTKEIGGDLERIRCKDLTEDES